jgi:hypothetical protein
MAFSSSKTLATVFLKSVRVLSLLLKRYTQRSLNLSFAPTIDDALVPI